MVYIKMQSHIVQLFDFKLHTDNDELFSIHELCTETHIGQHYLTPYTGVP